MTFPLMNKVTLTQTKSFNVILSSDTTKGSLEKIISEMAKMESELKEVKEKRCASTAPADQGSRSVELYNNIYPA